MSPGPVESSKSAAKPSQMVATFRPHPRPTPNPPRTPHGATDAAPRCPRTTTAPSMSGAPSCYAGCSSGSPGKPEGGPGLGGGRVLAAVRVGVEVGAGAGAPVPYAGGRMTPPGKLMGHTWACGTCRRHRPAPAPACGRSPTRGCASSVAGLARQRSRAASPRTRGPPRPSGGRPSSGRGSTGRSPWCGWRATGDTPRR